jgi:hypothetical protein
MPGALVHANLMASLIHFGTDPKENLGAKLELETLLILVSATSVTLLFWGVIEWFHWLHDRWQKSGKIRIPNFIVFVGEIITFLLVLTFTGLVVYYMNLWVGAVWLFRGIQVGSFVPVFAVLMEGLIHIGHLLYDWLHRAARWIIDRVWRPAPTRHGVAAVVLVALASGALFGIAEAWEPNQPVGFLRVEGDATAVTVQRSSGEKASPGKVYEIYLDDTIWVNEEQTKRGFTSPVWGLGQRKASPRDTRRSTKSRTTRCCLPNRGWSPA